MTDEAPAYGLWGLVVINSVVFVLFAYSFFKPRTPRDWRSFGAFSAFLVTVTTGPRKLALALPPETRSFCIRATGSKTARELLNARPNEPVERPARIMTRARRFRARRPEACGHLPFQAAQFFLPMTV